MITREENKSGGTGEVDQKVIFEKEILPLLNEIAEACEENGIPLMTAAALQSQGEQLFAVREIGTAPLFMVANVILSDPDRFLDWAESLP